MAAIEVIVRPMPSIHEVSHANCCRSAFQPGTIATDGAQFGRATQTLCTRAHRNAQSAAQQGLPRAHSHLEAGKCVSAA